MADGNKSNSGEKSDKLDDNVDILIVGEPSVDWFLLEKHESRRANIWEKVSDSKLRIFPMEGGALLLRNLLRFLLGKNKCQIAGMVGENEDNMESFHNITSNKIKRTLISYKEFPKSDDENKVRVLRAMPGCRSEKSESSGDHKSYIEQEVPKILIITDYDDKFNENELKNWPEKLWQGNAPKKHQKPEYIFLRIFSPNVYTSNTGEKNGDSPIFGKLIKLAKETDTTVLCTLHELHKCPGRIGPRLSWERTFEEIIRAIEDHKIFFNENDEMAFKRIIVTLPASGAVIIEKDQYTLIFDKEHQEGDWLKKRPGRVFGYNIIIMASLIMEIHKNGSNSNWAEAIIRGIEASRKLHESGYLFDQNDAQDKDSYFPYKLVTETLKKKQKEDPHRNYGTIVIKQGNKDKIIRAKNWNFISHNVAYKNSQGEIRIDIFGNIKIQEDQLLKLAKRIVKEGPKNVLQEKNIYLEEVKKLSSFDIQEIERIRNIRNIIEEYLRNWNLDKNPLAIAVFGPPGSGKSFAVKEVLDGLDGSARTPRDEPIENKIITYNLSQIDEPKELSTAFREIRDINLSGKIPCVFWDEFDCRLKGEELGWLRYFLAPIQDSSFYEDGFNRPLGPAVFIFAGGTCERFDDFAKNLKSEEPRKVKKPDFISRLKGHLNILGINKGFSDQLYTVRRALILRGLLEKNFEGIFEKEKEVLNGSEIEYKKCNINDGVLEAFLKIDEYKNGVRSMKAIINSGELQGKNSFEKSYLPSDDILNIHLDARKFLRLLDK